MPSTAYENSNMTKLFRIISDQYQNTNIAAVQRKYFNETKGTAEPSPFYSQHLMSYLSGGHLILQLKIFENIGDLIKEDLKKIFRNCITQKRLDF